jgi:hypothetical protein
LWTFFPLGLPLIFGLTAIIIGFFIETDYLNKKTLNQILYVFDIRYGALLPVPILWGLVCWFFVDCLSYFDFICKRRFWIRLVILSVIVFIVAFIFAWTFLWSNVYVSYIIRILTNFYRLIYYNIYITYVVNPTTNYMVTGIWDWKILTLPSIIIVSIVLFLFHIITKKRRLYHNQGVRP